MGSDELDELARRGRATEARAQRQDEDRTRDEGETKAREARMRCYASISGYVRGWWLALALVVALGCAALFPVACADGSVEGSADSWGMLGMLVGSGLGLAMWRLRAWVGERVVARTQRWLAARPFPVHGYLEALSGPTEGTASVGFRLVAPVASLPSAEPERGYRDAPPAPPATRAAPDPAWLADIVRGVGGALGAHAANGEYTATYEVSFEGSVGSNAHLDRWLRRLLRALELIHVEHPIERVRISGFV